METPSKRFTACEVIQIGQQVLKAKEQELKHGEFMAWIRRAHNVSEDTVERWMAVARKAKEAGIAPDDPALDNIMPTALYKLCEKRTSLDALSKAIALAREGEIVTVRMAQYIIEGKTIVQPSTYPTRPSWHDSSPIPFSSEEELLRALANDLDRKGVKYDTKVKCDIIGEADLVTSDSIYELKYGPRSDSLFKAIGQALMYREAIGRPLTPRILCTLPNSKKVRRMIELAKHLGVEIVRWEEY